jgi:hypothetical protein
MKKYPSYIKLECIFIMILALLYYEMSDKVAVHCLQKLVYYLCNMHDDRIVGL